MKEMRRVTNFMQKASLYVAPEMEILSVYAECGVAGSDVTIEDVPVKDYEEEF